MYIKNMKNITEIGPWPHVIKTTLACTIQAWTGCQCNGHILHILCDVFFQQI